MLQPLPKDEEPLGWVDQWWDRGLLEGRVAARLRRAEELKAFGLGLNNFLFLDSCTFFVFGHQSAAVLDAPPASLNAGYESPWSSPL